MISFIPFRNSNADEMFDRDQPVLLSQSKQWSRIILWSILGLGLFTGVWAAVTEIEEAIPATGKLEPEGAVKEIQAPVGGVVQEILVKEGAKVKKGDLLIRFDTTAAKAQLDSQTKIKNALLQEISFYQSQLAGQSVGGSMQGLNQTRNAIASENAVFNAQLNGGSAGLTGQQQQRIDAHQTALSSQIAKAKLDEEQARGQLREIDVQIESAQANLKMNQDILDRIAPLAAAGAIPQIQLMKQQQEVVRYQSQIDQAQAQKQRLALDIDKAQEVATATVATTQEETLMRISSNEKSLAELDTQANKVILENQKKIAEIDGQLQQAQLTMQYQELRAPADGTVFELKPSSPGFVANSSTPLLKIVPANGVIAKINITNKDIGFVKEGVPVDVRLDSFPFREFGDIKGTLTSIGSDALPPDQIHQYYRFPAKVALAGQVLQVNGREVPLQSGMSVNVNIKLRKRSVMSIFMEQVLKKAESMKFLR